MPPMNPRFPLRSRHEPLLRLAVCAWIAGCSVYDADSLQGSRSSATQVEPTADAGHCTTDCEVEPIDAAAPVVDCARDPEADGCRPHEAGPQQVDAGPQQVEAGPAPDQCPNDPAKELPGTCGCGQPDSDSDADGTLDCKDGCPQDPAKTAARVCGCGIPDSDTDADGTADCVDACPRDAKKTSVGVCGCGALDGDQDADGTADCVDMCPEDPAKTSAGICGCGNIDPGAKDQGAVFCTKRWLLHRYSFEGAETFSSDRVGRAHATMVLGDAASMPGAVTLSGDNGAAYNGEAYVALPESAWPRGESATFEAWVTWRGAAAMGGAAWQRIFDFGDQRAGAGESYVCLTPDGIGGVRATFTTGGSAREVFVITSSPLPRDVVKHLAVVVDGAAGTFSLYIDGRMQGWIRLPDKLSNIRAVNRWLGRSNYDVDPTFFGSVHEFRIFGAALTEAQLASSYAAGPDYAFAP